MSVPFFDEAAAERTAAAGPAGFEDYLDEYGPADFDWPDCGDAYFAGPLVLREVVTVTPVGEWAGAL